MEDIKDDSEDTGNIEDDSSLQDRGSKRKVMITERRISRNFHIERVLVSM